MAHGRQSVLLVPDLPVRDVLAVMSGGQGQELEHEVLERMNVLLGRCASHMRARASYVVKPVKAVEDSQILLAGCPPLKGAVAKYLGPARRAVVFVVQISRYFSDQAAQAAGDGNELDSRLYRAIGLAALDGAVDALMEHLWSHEAEPDEGVTLPVTPGSCGMPWDQNEALYAIAGCEPLDFDRKPLTPESLCSQAGLAGIAASADVEQHAIPCEFCRLDRCQVRHGVAS